MTITAKKFSEKEFKKTNFSSKIKFKFQKFTIALNNKIKKDRNFKLDDFLNGHKPPLYSDNVAENVSLYNQHYQNKFRQTGKQEYNVLTFNLELLDANQDITNDKLQQFQALFDPHSFNDGTDKKKIVFYDDLHCTPAIITDDNKIFVFRQTETDHANLITIQNLIIQSDNNTEGNFIKSLYTLENINVNYFNPAHSLQRSSNGCVLFAHKYLKLLSENNYRLFDEKKLPPPNTSTLHKEEDEEEHDIILDGTFILPPDLLKYAQSDRVIHNIIKSYKKHFGKELIDKSDIDLKEEELLEYRNNKYGKFHILYHQIKHYSGDDIQKKEMIDKLNKSTNEL